ncbi:unnamed protein product [Medioppia subpectinata]|uniref:General transcription factor IIF subunit 2 n=1 Tax=Medioppia subpectinata TaxID=1979941 RepID=A0A7R9L1R1_9ACAR|nr:unnamed protein product [Medioppia subpectinata]CAG2113890.1 unnamed protein product [Medioppia subpectinata]
MQEIGRIRMSGKLSGDESTQIDFTIAKELTEIPEDPEDKEANKENGDQSIPKEHQFSLSRVDNQSLVLFSVDDSKDTQQISFDGIVDQKGECRPVMSNRFLALNKMRAIRATQPPNGRQPVKQLDRTITVFKPISRHPTTTAKKGSLVKNCREDREPVRNKLFKAFEKHQYYHLKDLQMLTGQPLSYLKIIVRELCVYNVKNPHKYMWELKPEFRHYGTIKPISRHPTTTAKKGSLVKNCREDREPVRNKLFKAFENHQYYHLKDLQMLTGQPLSYLKIIVRELCVYNVKNPHKYMWELKPEFRHYGTIKAANSRASG